MKIYILLLWLIFNMSFAYSDLSNKMCPVTTDEKIDSKIYTEYKGKKVYFCCKRCLRKFLKIPNAYIQNLPQFSNSKNISKAKHSHKADHDHQSHGQKLQGFSRVLNFLGKFHPVSIHFPIALILAGLLAEFLAWWTKKSLFVQGARLMVIMAGISAVLAVLLGWIAGAFASYPGQLSSILTYHRWLGTSAGIFIVLTTIFSELSHRYGNKFKTYYRFVLCISAILVVITGHLGGTLIYGINHYVF